MDNIKQNWPKLAVGTAVGAITLFVLYKLLSKESTGAISSEHPFT